MFFQKKKNSVPETGPRDRIVVHAYIFAHNMLFIHILTLTSFRKRNVVPFFLRMECPFLNKFNT